MTLFEKLKELGHETVDPSFYDKVEEWKSWYIGDVKKFSWYRVRTGREAVKCKRFSLQMAKKLSEDWANLLMNEKVKITLEGEKEQTFVDEVFDANNFWVKANEMQEMKSALGTAAYIPRVVGQREGDTAEKISLDYVTVEHIWPLAWQNGIVTECAFDSIKVVDGKEYLYLQIHTRNEAGEYVIKNRIYLYRDGQLSDVDLAEVPGFENLPQSVETHSKERQFVIDRLNIANNFDPSNPLGISVYANAIDVLKGVDVAYDSYVNEFILGKKRIMVKPQATNYLDGEPMFDPSDTVFYLLPEDAVSDSVITQVDMSLRTQEHNTGIQDQLNFLSSKCGFGENHYRFDNGGVATATEVVSQNSTLFRTLKKHEIILESVLVELCRIILRLGNQAMKAGLNEDVEISIDFDDSIIEDETADFARDMQLLNAGILNPWEFRSKWMNEDEATAKKMLPGMETLVEEGQDEVE